MTDDEFAERVCEAAEATLHTLQDGVNNMGLSDDAGQDIAIDALILTLAHVTANAGWPITRTIRKLAQARQAFDEDDTAAPSKSRAQ